VVTVLMRQDARPVSLVSRVLFSGQVDLVEVVGTKWSTTLGALAQSRVVALADTLRTEDMEALGEDRIFLPTAATWTVQLGLSSTHTSTDSSTQPVNIQINTDSSTRPVNTRIHTECSTWPVNTHIDTDSSTWPVNTHQHRQFNLAC